MSSSEASVTLSVSASSAPSSSAQSEKMSKNDSAHANGNSVHGHDLIEYPIISLSDYLCYKSSPSSAQGTWKSDCSTIARLFHNYGFLIIQDPRVPDDENEKFVDMLERYYDQDEKVRQADVRPEYAYQVGMTPQFVELARNHCPRVASFPSGERPISECPPRPDSKSRFFWTLGDKPPKTDFPKLNMDNVVPAAFKDEWSSQMNRWGKHMLTAVETLAEMTAIGLGLDSEAFVSKMKFGPHLLAPTGSDLNKFAKLDTVFASFHYDLNFMTIHGRSRFPGLFVWSRDGKKIPVKVPPKCLLVQAGKQLEWLTGGYVLAGFHEVVCTEETLKAVEQRKVAGKSLWRISSTVFSHIASDEILKPLGRFDKEQGAEKYGEIQAGKQVQEELEAIKLWAKEEGNIDGIVIAAM